MSYWVTARSPDGKTYMGMIAGLDSVRVHTWLQIDTSSPFLLIIHNIPVLSFQFYTDGPVVTEPFWGLARLELKKSWGPGRSGILKEVQLHVNSTWAFNVLGWNEHGLPNLTHTAPGWSFFPQSFRQTLPATLIQAGRFRHIYSTKRHVRREDEEDGDNNNRRGLKRGPKGGGGRRGQVAT